MFGVLNLNKLRDATSRDVVNVIQRLVKPVKVGHAGTLDPMATGVLLVCLGGATRLISLLQKSPKTYLAEFILGQRSNTDDNTGDVEDIFVANPPDEAVVKRALSTFVGQIDQVPPAFSAVKVSGQRAYSIARRGEDVELKSKQVYVHSMELLSYSWPKLELKIECGSGTYIRSIARDLGEQLGCGGLMSALQRTSIGSFDVADAVDAESLTVDNLPKVIYDPIQIVSELPQYRCTAEDVVSLKAGRRLHLNPDRMVKNEFITDELTALTCPEGKKLLAMAEQVNGRATLQPRIVFVK